MMLLQQNGSRMIHHCHANHYQKILERIWDKKSYCTNGKGKVKEKYQELHIDHFIKYHKAKLEHICPYQILEKIDMYSIMNYIIDLIDDGFITKDEFIF